LQIRVCRVVDGVKTVRQGSVSSSNELSRAIDSEGWSLQVMHPQRRSASVHSLLFDLENETGTLWGANSYITPPASQGFKPHYDDVEVFMLQLEGRKRWRIFEGVELAREYSPEDFEEADLRSPLLDEWLEAGDMLCVER
jgi:lysine-specific demethylase/histidyl-hydroxylase NO66